MVSEAPDYTITTATTPPDSDESQDISVTAASSAVTSADYDASELNGVLIQNIGAVDCFYTFGATATTSGQKILAGETHFFGDVLFLTVAAITASSATTLRVTWFG